VKSISPIQPPTFSHLVINSHNVKRDNEIRCTILG